MYKLKNSLLTLVGLLALIGVVAAITPFKSYGQRSPAGAATVQDVQVVNTTAMPVPTQDVNARKASDIVSLMSTSSGFRRVTANGVLGGNEFIVPADQALIVTDVEWVRTCGSCTAGPNDKITLEVFGSSGSHRPVFTSVAPTGSNGQSGDSDTMNTGFVVGEGGHVGIAPAFTNASNTLTVYLHGYLVPAT
jgi:hypothetical protein